MIRIGSITTVPGGQPIFSHSLRKYGELFLKNQRGIEFLTIWAANLQHITVDAIVIHGNSNCKKYREILGENLTLSAAEKLREITLQSYNAFVHGSVYSTKVGEADVLT